MSPLVSIVMPCRNAGPMLRPALWSVFAQSYPNLELIFVDNNSTDGSAELARSLAAGSAGPVRFLHCAAPGANNARNLGYTVARGEYIQWMDADDALGLQKIEHQVAALEREPGADIAYCDYMASRHLPDGRREDKIIRFTHVDDQILRSLNGTWYPPHSYLIRRKAADRLQTEQAWYSETKIGTDVEYSAIAALLGMRFLHVADSRVQYNTWSPAQLSGADTKYAVRVAALEAIYRRLAQFARRRDVAPRVKARHWTLLEQEWSVWTMRPGSVTIRQRSPRLLELHHTATGRTIEARPREATVAAAMQALGHSRASGHYAPLIAAHAPSLERDIPFIVATINRFRRAGLLEAVDLGHMRAPVEA